MGKCPAFQFYPSDWTNDPQLQMAGTASKGVWIQLLCAMWWSPTRGAVTGTVEDLARLARSTTQEMEAFLADARAYKFADVTFGNSDVTVTNRRMWREQRARESTRSRVQRHRESRSNADITVPSSSTSSTSSSSTSSSELKDLGKTLGAAAPKPAPAAPDKVTPWAPALDEIRQYLLQIQAPDEFFKESYWLRIDQWVGGPDSGVYYFRELTAYLTHQESKNGGTRGKHKDLRAGFRNWLATTKRWRERDAQRATIASRYRGPDPRR